MNIADLAAVLSVGCKLVSVWRSPRRCIETSAQERPCCRAASAEIWRRRGGVLYQSIHSEPGECPKSIRGLIGV